MERKERKLAILMLFFINLILNYRLLKIKIKFFIKYSDLLNIYLIFKIKFIMISKNIALLLFFI